MPEGSPRSCCYRLPRYNFVSRSDAGRSGASAGLGRQTAACARSRTIRRHRRASCAAHRRSSATAGQKAKSAQEPFIMMSSCDPGRGNPPWCNVSRATIFGSHDPFAGFRCGRHGHMAAAKYIPGWSAGYEVYFDVVQKVNATVTIEVGVWKGLSTAYMASGVRARDRVVSS